MALEHPERPFVAILGGAKVSDKIQVIESLLPRGRRAAHRRRHGLHVLPRPGLADGQEPGRGGQVDAGHGAARRGGAGKIVLPVDHVVAASVRGRRRAQGRCRSPKCPTAGWASTSARSTAQRLRRAQAAGAKIVVWNGPMGVFEMEPFARGHAGRGPGPGRQRGHHHRRRRRQRGRGHADGPGRQDRPRLHRRRRLARVPGRRELPGVACAADGVLSHCRNAMRDPCIAGNWKMYKTVAEARRAGARAARGAWRAAATVRGRRRAAVHGARRRGRGLRRQHRRLGAQNMHWEKRGRLHRRGLRADAEDAGCTLRDPRPLRAPPALRRDRRDGVKRARRALAARPHADRLRRRDARRARARTDTLEVVERQVERGARGLSAGRRARSSCVAYEPVWAIGTGRTATPAQAAGGPRAHPRAARARSHGDAAADASASSTAAASSPTTSPRSWPSPTSTAPSSAGPRSTRPAFSRSPASTRIKGS